jgi:hypothetical protein
MMKYLLWFSSSEASESLNPDFTCPERRMLSHGEQSISIVEIGPIKLNSIRYVFEFADI